jgi:hypothetical protein
MIVTVNVYGLLNEGQIILIGLRFVNRRARTRRALAKSIVSRHFTKAQPLAPPFARL